MLTLKNSLIFGLMALAMLCSSKASAQYKTGNFMYSNSTPVVLTADHINVPVNFNQSNVITIKGMFNAEPDAYVAIFSISQEGEDEHLSNQLIDNKITAIREAVQKLSDKITLDVDVISFVPIYDHVLEKKVFSKNTFTEEPVGFELKKNIIIEFQKSEQFDKIFSVCTQNGVYDYVRTDVVVSDMSKIKTKLRERADSMVEMQLKRYAMLLDIDLKDYRRTLSEGYAVIYPGEKYENYTAFSSTSYFTKKFNLSNDQKKVTKHYLPIIDKEFDFVVNPVISKPAIQVMYQINLALVKKPEPVKSTTPPAEVQKEVFFITPQGDLKRINL